MQHKSAYIWGLIGRFAPQGIHLITTMVLARFLTPDDFGKIGVLSIIFVVANTLLDSGLGGSLVKEKEISRIDCSTIGAFNISVSLFIYIILFIFADHIESYFNIEGLASIVRTISLVFPFTAFGIVPKAILNRNLAFRQSCNNAIIGAVVASIASIVGAALNGGVYALVIYQVVVAAVTVICNYYSSKYKFSLRFSFSSLRRLLPFGIMTTITSVIDTIYENLLTTMTGKYMSVQQAGYVYQAKKIEDISSTSLATTIGTVTFPILTKLKDKIDEFTKEAESTFILITSLAFPLLTTISIHSYTIITLLFGEKWYDAGLYLKILTIAGMFMVAETLVRNFIKALCEVKRLMYVTILKRIIGISLILGTLVISPDDMIYAYVLSAAVGLVLNNVLYSKISRTKLLKQLVLFVKLIMPSVCYFIVFAIFNMGEHSIWIQITYSIVSLLVIYLLVIPFYGVNLLKFIKNGE